MRQFLYRGPFRAAAVVKCVVDSQIRLALLARSEVSAPRRTRCRPSPKHERLAMQACRVAQLEVDARGARRGRCLTKRCSRRGLIGCGFAASVVMSSQLNVERYTEARAFLMPRSPTPKATETDLLVASRRRCSLCFGLTGDHSPKAGQIAHVDRDASNSTFENLAWLCLPHHDEYDSRRSQSKGFTPGELRRYRDELYEFIVVQRGVLEPTGQYQHFSHEALALATVLNSKSRNGYKFDPQLRLAVLPGLLEMASDDVEIAVDELVSTGLAELSGSRDFVFATHRLFWETDAIFRESDPATDAEAVARALVAGPLANMSLSDLSAQLGWPPRRLNPAVSFLVETGNARGVAALGSAPYWSVVVARTTATKRLVRDRDRAQT